MQLVSKYLIYALCHPITEEIRYFGKSEKWLIPPRRHGKEKYMKRQRHLPVVRWISRLHSQNMDYIIKIIEEFSDNLTLSEREKYWIALYGGPVGNPGSRLLNCTDGGDGMSGHKPSPETIEKRRQKIIGVPRPKAVLDALLAANTGAHRSEETKAKISASLVGNSYRKGVPHTPESKASISKGLRSYWERLEGKWPACSEEKKAKIRAANTGKHLSEETKRKISEKLKGKKKPRKPKVQAQE